MGRGSLTSSNDFTLILTFAGTTDTITIFNTLSGYRSDTIEQIVFDDGTVWTMADARRLLIAQSQTDGNDTVIGFITHGHADRRSRQRYVAWPLGL